VIYSLLSSCSSGLDLLTVYLLAMGYSRAEAAELLHTSPPVISRRMSRIYNNFMRESRIS
jgi:hypothetical protein